MYKFIVGSVTSVKGINIRAKINSNLHQATYFYNGEIYRGIAINEFVMIRKGYHDIIGKIEGEEIIENSSLDPNTLSQKRFERFVDIKTIGYFQANKFYSGIKYLPMIEDSLHLITDQQISQIYTFNPSASNFSIAIGSSLLEQLPIHLPINGLYNSHIGIFGNTGSGKSNTLAKLYFSLFEKMIEKENFRKFSEFLFIDFNGEYQAIADKFEEYSSYLVLNTQLANGEDKLELLSNSFWDDEFLSVLFSATEKTQKPFLAHLVKNKKTLDESLSKYLERTLHIMFGPNQHKETVNLLKSMVHIITKDPDEQKKIEDELARFHWFSKDENNKYYFDNKNFVNTPEDAIEKLDNLVEICRKNLNNIDVFDEVIIRATFQLINSVSRNYVQYDHINPLINKISAMSNGLSKVINIVDEYKQSSHKTINIISLRNCNQDVKKAIPMVLAKCMFLSHKSKYDGTNSFHFIIDEAHNILSEMSVREAESWKDYRLELFEEIIKEGRKFGFFITISSQRTADISPTIISQLHNYFLHRLVNENDLFLLKNTINTLDLASRSQIPILSAGACILSGTAFHTPILIQVDKLLEEHSPKSETINLEKLWGINDN